jgi:predicted thioesterase
MKRRVIPRKRSAPAKKAKRSAISHAPVAGMPRIGLESSVQRVVPHEWTIAAFDPRLPPVLSTPAMIGMMEIAALQAVQPELPSGAITVGTRIEVEARSGDLVLGRGKVFRAIVDNRKFAQPADDK